MNTIALITLFILAFVVLSIIGTYVAVLIVQPFVNDQYADCVVNDHIATSQCLQCGADHNTDQAMCSERCLDDAMEAHFTQEQLDIQQAEQLIHDIYGYEVADMSIARFAKLVNDELVSMSSQARMCLSCGTHSDDELCNNCF